MAGMVGTDLATVIVTLRLGKTGRLSGIVSATPGTPAFLSEVALTGTRGMDGTSAMVGKLGTVDKTANVPFVMKGRRSTHPGADTGASSTMRAIRDRADMVKIAMWKDVEVTTLTNTRNRQPTREANASASCTSKRGSRTSAKHATTENPHNLMVPGPEMMAGSVGLTSDAEATSNLAAGACGGCVMFVVSQAQELGDALHSALDASARLPWSEDVSVTRWSRRAGQKLGAQKLPKNMWRRPRPSQKHRQPKIRGGRLLKAMQRSLLHQVL
mmetsp:Transcript_10447/g.24178  ORF Transcript_10447/g.24178 Transcript_10447/m.24178 type:complete len:271 (+) Transcript_10447:537-1349(+)